MKYEIVFEKAVIEQIHPLKKSGKKELVKKIGALVDELIEHPFSGTGKPEPLRYNLSGLWSRRINKEHRIIYQVTDEQVTILSVWGHYGDR